MTDVVAPAVDPTVGRACLRRHGRSFHWAARLLPADQADALAALYGVCRVIDDVADETPDPHHARARLDRIAAELGRSQAIDPVARQAHALIATHGLDPTLLQHLIAGVRGDLGPVALADEAALLRYAYHVAGTVGLMICDVLQVRAAAARPFAIDLGLAMQMTNIARDVATDATMGRVYLPGDWIDGAGAAEVRAAATDPAHPLRPRLCAAVLRLLDLADRHYASAARGMGYLPPSARLGLQTAARVYRAIGTRLRWRGGDALKGRARVSQRAKVGLTVATLVHASVSPSLHRLPRQPHDPLLHRALAGLPGANA